MEPLKVPPQRTGDVNRKRCRMHSRPAEHVLIESQEEVRSDLRSRKFAQIRSIIQAGSGNGS
jgi:hypothetical protein